MPKRDDIKINKTNIWQNIDFQTVKQRLNRITDKLEEVLSKSYQIEATELLDPEDYAKLREFMEVNQLTESQAIAIIINAFFSNTPQQLSNPPSSPDETQERLMALEQQMAELLGKLPIGWRIWIH